MKPLALFDLDGTLVDFDGAMRKDLESIAGPNDPSLTYNPDDSCDPPWMYKRKHMIKRQPNWWVNLPLYVPGWHVLHYAKEIGFDIHILSKGPSTNYNAWSQKLEWCRLKLEDTPVTITEEKGLVYGRVLVDDWPPYIISWLKWRPRGTIIMPAHPWNEGFDHPQIVRYDGVNINQVKEALFNQFNRK